MNLSRMRSVVSGLNGQARKIYDRLPTDRSVDVSDMMSILGDCGMRPGRNVVEGVLNHLWDSGLVERSSTGRFLRRVPSGGSAESTKPALSVVPTESAPAAPDLPKAPRTPLDDLAEIETRIGAAVDLVGGLGKMLDGIREAVAAAAVNVQDHVDSIRKEQSKLDALRSLLKDI